MTVCTFAPSVCTLTHESATAIATAEMTAIRFVVFWLISLPSLRPGRALILRHVRHALEIELLKPLAFERLDGVDVALRVGRDGMHGEELARLPAAFTEARELGERLTVEDVDLHVLTVGDIEVFLIAVAREGDVPNGAGALGAGSDARLLHEFARRLEDLNAIVGSVAYI